MTPLEDLRISIEALSAYNIEPAIIRNMLVNLDKVTDAKPILRDSVNHCKRHKIVISSRIIDEFIDNKCKNYNNLVVEKSWTLMCTMNSGLITQEEWDKSSAYAKQELKRKCLIVVKEVLGNLDSLSISHLGTFLNPKVDFWQEVKRYLENL